MASAVSSRSAATARSVSKMDALRELSKGLKIDAEFCPPDVADPFDTVKWSMRTAAIKDDSGGVFFEQHDAEIPESWSQLATNVVVSKYFYGELNTPERETSVRQLIGRVTRTIADWGREDGYFASAEDAERFYDELTFGVEPTRRWLDEALTELSRDEGGPLTLTAFQERFKIREPEEFHSDDEFGKSETFRALRNVWLRNKLQRMLDERVTLKCQIPRCFGYGVGAHCPPNTLKPAELRDIRKALNTLMRALRRRRPERGPAQHSREAIDILLDHLDRDRDLYPHRAVRVRG